MSNTTEVVIVDAIRTPMGRSKGGAFRNMRAEELSAHLMTSLLERNPAVNPEEIEDIIWGCVQQTLEQAYNVGRNAQLLTKIPFGVSAQTVNRLCGSSMTALHTAAMSIQAGYGDVFDDAGVEPLGNVPMTYGFGFNRRGNTPVSRGSQSMGLTSELLACLRTRGVKL